MALPSTSAAQAAISIQAHTVIQELMPIIRSDLPNLDVNEAGVGTLKATTSRITLSDGPLSIFDANGSAIVIHLNVDQGSTGVTGGSGGERIACGVIAQDN